MSTRRWNRIQKLKQAYKLANTIKRGMKQAEKAPVMTVEQAMRHIEELYAFLKSSTVPSNALRSATAHCLTMSRNYWHRSLIIPGRELNFITVCARCVSVSPQKDAANAAAGESSSSLLSARIALPSYISTTRQTCKTYQTASSIRSLKM